MNGHMEKEKYAIGDLLWAKIGNHPFWPCMVSYDPIEGCYSKTRKARNGVVKIYHVQYFGKQVQHGWTTPGSIFPFEGEQKFHELRAVALNNAATPGIKKKLEIKYGVPRKIEKAWLVSVREAELALPVDCQERFETFVFKYETNPKKSAAKNGTSSKRHRKHKGESNKPSKKAREASGIIDEICKICEMGSVDLTCAGKCFQSYHKECLGIIHAPKDFKCLDCENGLLSCFVCKVKVADTSLTKCNKCNYHYHDECMKKYECANFQKKICSLHVCLTCHNENPRNISSKGPFVQCFRCPTIFHATEKCKPMGSVELTPSLIICPDHFLGKDKISPQPTINFSYCSVCSEGGELICCESCPNSYHVQCMNKEVPSGDFFCEDCLKRRYLYIGMIVWAKTGVFRWWPAQVVRPGDLPSNIGNMEKYYGEFPLQYFGTDEYFWTHRGRVIPYAEHHKDYNKSGSKQCKLTSQYKISLEEAAEAFDEYIFERQKQKPYSKPDAYKHIKINRAVPPAHITVLDAKYVLPCTCISARPSPCGPYSVCLNRSMQMECHTDVCVAGERCENQKFQKRQYVPVKIIRTENRGWGLETQKFISRGSFVIEYVGEVITHEEYHERTIKMREENNQNYYFLYLDSRRMIDAGPKGNLARFINHSCNPNCEMEKWSVNGDLRIGIFALTNILPGEELTFNYQFDSIQFKQKCHCGSAFCQGFIGRSKMGRTKMGRNIN